MRSNLPAIEPRSNHAISFTPPSVDQGPGRAVASPGLAPMRVLAEGSGTICGPGAAPQPDAFHDDSSAGYALAFSWSLLKAFKSPLNGILKAFKGL